jgi:hypothetical protein
VSLWLLHIVAIGASLLLVQDETARSCALVGVFLALAVQAAGYRILQAMLKDYLPYLVLFLVCFSFGLDEPGEYTLMASWVVMLVWLLIPES